MGEAHPFHSVLIVRQVVQAERNACRRHGASRDLQKLLNSSVCDEFCRKLLMEEERGEILMTDGTEGEHSWETT